VDADNDDDSDDCCHHHRDRHDPDWSVSWTCDEKRTGKVDVVAVVAYSEAEEEDEAAADEL